MIGVTQIVLAAMMIVAQPSTKPARLRIIREPSTFEQRKMDRADLPKNVTFGPDMIAHTHAWDNCHSYVFGPVVKREERDGKHVAAIRVDGFEITLKLRVVTWLPDDASPKLMRHEHGHRRISEKRYDDADLVVRPIAESLIRQIFEGVGATPDEAKANAYLAAGSKLANTFYAECSRWQWVHDRYDELTNYGRDASIEEPEAIRQAFREFERLPASATQSAGKK